jgi:predicted DNA-binding transcriptional regulator AlpA
MGTTELPNVDVHYLTAPEVAALLRISVRTLHTYVLNKRVPAPLRLGGKRLWTAQALHDHVGSARHRKRA